MTNFTALRRALAVAGTFVLIAPLYLAHAGDNPVPTIMPATPCDGKCNADYEAECSKCAKVASEAERDKCGDSAYAHYKSCLEACKPKNDCLEHCKEQCEKAWEQCRDNCPRGNKDCLNNCSHELGRCFKECEKKCQ